MDKPTLCHCVELRITRKHNPMNCKWCLRNRAISEYEQFLPDALELLRIMDNLMHEGKGIFEYAQAIARRIGKENA